MTKSEVANELMSRTGLARREAVLAVEIFLDCMKRGIRDGQKVSLVGFGTFRLKGKGARNGRNPRTGEQIFIPEKKVVVFKPGKSFRDQVEGSPDQPGEPAAPPAES